MKKLWLPLWALSLFLFVGCSSDDDNAGDDDGQGGGEVEGVQLNNEVSDFIWKGLNYWYFWQDDVTDLADDRFADTDAYHTFLNDKGTPEDVFNSLVDRNVDDFSWYIEDVEEQLNSFRGISESYGIGLGYLVRVSEDSNAVVIYVSYVTPDSPADRAEIKRGDLIYKVDGTAMNTTNFRVVNNIFTNTNVTLGFARISGGELIPFQEEKSLTAELLTTNPVHHQSIIEQDGKKVGYLVFNSFNNTFHQELNDAFTNFKQEGIEELVLDLRYNGGGSVLTSALLASMIAGNEPGEASVFARLQYNSKRDEANGVVFPFFDEIFLYNKQTGDFEGRANMTRLTNLSRLFVITSDRTASASEMIINGIRPIMPVTLIGDKTVGKNEGSITVVDAPAAGADSDPFTDTDNRNPDHTVGMQPIVFQIFNRLGQSDYSNGFEPDVLEEEFRYANNIKPFGDVNEPLLSAALNIISGASTKKAALLPNASFSKMDGGLQLPKFSEEMYLLPQEEQQLQ